MEIKRVSPEEAKQLIEDESYVYIDVRTAEEFAAAHVPGAKNVPVLERTPAGMQPNAKFVQVVEANFSKDFKCVLGCLRGMRSLRAAHMLIDAGFTGIVDMRGGFDGEPDGMGGISFDGWQRRGLPISTEAPPENTYEELKKKAD